MFVFKQWDKFCRKIKDNDIVSESALTVLMKKTNEPFIILKHDVETSPLKALKLAQIENKYSHKGTYYIQAYLLNNKKNIIILKQIQRLGHEVTYHHDVMDNNRGNLIKAKEEFQRNVKLFEKYDFTVKTVCQHGNPIIERNGYSSNRDFFRDNEIAQSFRNITDIMVGFKSKICNNHIYISDAGYGWKIIYDPENNDVINNSYKDIALGNLEEVLAVIEEENYVIVSTHPHRWSSNMVKAKAQNIIFRHIKFIAKYMLKISFVKKVMGKFYYLAKRI